MNHQNSPSTSNSSNNNMKNQHLIDALNKLPDNWTPLPVDRNKRPLVDDWQKGFSRETVIEILTNGYHGINKEGKPYFNPASTYTGFGFLTGELSGGIVAIDCDGVAAHELAERLGGLPKTVSFTSGKEGRAQYLYKMPPEFWGAIQTKKLNTGVKENNKDVLLELRWDGCQSVLPPSQHPETDGYKWINDPSTPIAECPNWIIEQMLIVPKVTASTPPELPLLSYPEKNNNYRDEPIPLLNCLSKDHRSLIESGAGEGGRNDGGAKVARDLIGTESRLQYLGFEFTGRARDLFDDYCDRCNPRINDKERETIWDSATKSHPTPCLSDDKLENCYKAWNRKSSTYTTSRTFNTGNKPDNSVSISDRNLNPKRKKATKNEIYAALEQVKKIAPPQHSVCSASSSFTKLIALAQQASIGFYFLHQADWIGYLLHGKLGISDYHNALKLGYDPILLSYPDWLKDWTSQNPAIILPQVFAPSTTVANIQEAIANKLNLPLDCEIGAGTTDSNAAFLASVGTTTPNLGTAVTSLGSTMVLKVLSDRPINNPDYGIYSHRFEHPDLGCLWLVGGASNVGGAVLQQFFTDSELQELSDRINPQISSPLDYYPLPKIGDRFPINDPHLAPRLEPRPDDPVEFLHGLLESMARIEANGYQLLQDLGCSPIQQIYTAGGGAKNQVWAKIRDRYLQIPMQHSLQTEASYGAALLAKISP